MVVRDATGTGHVDLGDVPTTLDPNAARYGCITGGDLGETLLGIAGPLPDAIQVLRHAPSTLVSRVVLDQNTVEKLVALPRQQQWS
ncbi:hypothetical protein D4740_02325 [Actinomyces sp. 2119]|uniref:Uncharacterized protein n=1 Tax=Actinomyces lilanjuaniae TaxID=2321394 RepID=A0ABM6Z169_9ACTO|nr:MULTISPECIES: hypothetical protein [Actinomyces]AYD88870.1 hypothetical protein D5R93_00190 [Actinomyces lilanjuaniae]RJF43825.1 hypothetical protein D4740_02325 [Actinomyces sp. 2119]